jgi:glycerol-3-phosphate acyltransferase PlsY
MEALLFLPLFYIYGSVPFAFIFAYIIKGEVLYEQGSKNISVANAFTSGGLLIGFLTVVGELSKVALPLIISKYFFDYNVAISLTFVFATLLGANFPIYLRRKSGYGATILIFSLLVLSPITVILLCVTALVSFAIIKDAFRTVRFVYIFLPVALLLVERNIPFLLFGILTATLFNLRYERYLNDFTHYKPTEKLKRLWREKKP